MRATIILILFLTTTVAFGQHRNHNTVDAIAGTGSRGHGDNQAQRIRSS